MAVLSQIHGIAGACSVIMWLILAHALLRSGPTGEHRRLPSSRR